MRLHLQILNETRLVTLSAIDTVLVAQPIPRLPVFKLLDPTGPIHHSEVPPLVLNVTGLALHQLAAFHPTVVAALFLDPFVQQLVALQTALAVHHTAALVALLAVAHPFQMLVRLRQLAWREQLRQRQWD